MNIDRGDIPPGAEAAVRRFQNSLAAVSTQIAHLRRVADEPIEPFTGVSEEHLDRMASSANASPPMVAAAIAIRNGQCSWREIVEGYFSQPPEITDIIREGIPFSFATARLAPPTARRPGYAEERQPTNWAPPSALYDDYDEENQTPESWLE
ncbi:hypothetical protein [Nocardia thailandica]